MVATMRLNPGVVRSTQPRRMHVAMCAWRVVPRCIEWPQVSREHMEHGLTGASTPASQPGAPPPSSPHNPTSGQPGKPLTAPAAVWLERRSYEKPLSKPDVVGSSPSGSMLLHPVALSQLCMPQTSSCFCV